MMYVYFGIFCLLVSTIVCIWADSQGLDATLPVAMILFVSVSGIGFGALPIMPRLFWRFAFGKNWIEEKKARSDSESALVFGLPCLCLGIILLATGLWLLPNPFKIAPGPALFSLTVIIFSITWFGAVIGVVVGLEVLLARRMFNRKYGPFWPDPTQPERG
ncbi:hypothetical protein KKI23_03520 [Patescibacteria group bacterium]|nr:hypothetical protein [Patescibacteria group bacterium]